MKRIQISHVFGSQLVVPTFPQTHCRKEEHCDCSKLEFIQKWMYIHFWSQQEFLVHTRFASKNDKHKNGSKHD